MAWLRTWKLSLGEALKASCQRSQANMTIIGDALMENSVINGRI
jgi:hypothetical protein